MTPDEIDCIDNPRSEKTILAVVEKMLVTMDLAKPGISKEQWIPLLEGKERLPKPEKILYDRRVNKICRLIAQNNIDIADVVKKMETMTTHTIDTHLGGKNGCQIYKSLFKWDN